MKDTLIKKDGQFYCLDEKTVIIGTTDEALLKHKPLVTKKLSLKNCQSIELGYDLDELVIDEIPDSSSTTLQVQRMRFIHGFQKALEILGDKKFSEEDMYKMFIYGDSITTAKKHVKALEDKSMDDLFNDFVQSLQQTEWDVEVVMGPTPLIFMARGRRNHGILPDLKPKLDEDGCLILKRI